MRVTVLRADSYRRTRWKNGGGETREIAISPPGASLDDFDWRISVATVESDGPFSTFTGVDRTLCILDGAGIRLTINAEPPRLLDAASDPFAFSGDAAAHSTLVDGTVTDFNVMTRRDRLQHIVWRLRLEAGDVRDLTRDVRVVICESGSVTAAVAGERAQLEALDTLLCDATDGRLRRITADTPSTICVVSISGAASRAGEGDRSRALA